MSKPIPLLDLAAGHRELAAQLNGVWSRLLGAPSHTLGPDVEAFESAFAGYCGVNHCIGVACGLDALNLILRAAGVGPEDEVILPTHTYIAPWLAVSHCGAIPVGVDCEADGFNIDPEAAAAAITPATRAIIAVHLYGQPANMDALADLAKAHSILLIEDAAQSHGASWRGRRTGSLGDAAAFSFFPSKNLGALGDGGAVCTNNASLAEAIRLLRNYGQRSRYDHAGDGYNSRLDPLQAAILTTKLEVLDSWQQRRAALAATYNGAISHPGVVLPSPDPRGEHAWHLFVVRAANREALRQRLAEDGIETVVHYPLPSHRQPVYRDLPMRVHPTPHADRLCSEVLSLPMGPHVTSDDARRVIAAVNGD